MAIQYRNPDGTFIVYPDVQKLEVLCATDRVAVRRGVEAGERLLPNTVYRAELDFREEVCPSETVGCQAGIIIMGQYAKKDGRVVVFLVASPQTSLADRAFAAYREVPDHRFEIIDVEQRHAKVNSVKDLVAPKPESSGPRDLMSLTPAQQARIAAILAEPDTEVVVPAERVVPRAGNGFSGNVLPLSP